MRFTHINTSAVKIAAKTDPELLPFSNIDWLSSSDHGTAKALLVRLVDPVASIRRLYLGRGFLGLAVVVTAPVLYPSLQRVVPTVILHCEKHHSPEDAQQDLEALTFLLHNI